SGTSPRQPPTDVACGDFENTFEIPRLPAAKAAARLCRLKPTCSCAARATSLHDPIQPARISLPEPRRGFSRRLAPMQGARPCSLRPFNPCRDHCTSPDAASAAEPSGGFSRRAEWRLQPPTATADRDAYDVSAGTRPDL